MKYYSYELYHYGLKGMKWGTRRWQYDDGRFNEAGKARYFGQTSAHRPRSVKELQGDLRSYKKNTSASSDNLGSKRSSEQKLSNDNKQNSVSIKTLENEKSYLTGKKSSDSVLKRFSNRKVNDDKHLNTEGSTNLKDVLGVSDEQAEKIKKYAKVAGISLATAGGIALAGYIVAKQPQLLENVYNKDKFLVRSVQLGQNLFDNPYNGNYVGKLAKEHGYHRLSAAAIKQAIAHPTNRKVNYDELIKNVRLNQIKDENYADIRSFRRLSCWSASQAYWLNSLTGFEFTSKSFENLVNFNDFGKLYNKMPKIFTASGRRSLLFVGKFGEKGVKATEKTAKSLVENIFKHINSNNNLTQDGMKTIGFINAGYHDTTCTHEWNFELLHNLNGSKSLIMADGYTGKRFFVGNLLNTGKVDYDGNGLAKLVKELSHYNSSSIRFYAPSLASINPEMLSEVILGRL